MHLKLKMISVVFLCLLVVVGAWGVFGWVLIETIHAREVVAKKEEERKVIQEKVAYSETLRSLLHDTAEERDVLADISTLSAVDIVELMRLSAQDASLDVAIDSIAPATVRSETVKNVPALTVSMSAHGSFRDLYHLLVLFENLPIPAKIDQVTFENRGGTGSWSLRMRVIVYTERSI